MPTTIKLKNSVTTTSVPSSLVQGEVAINITDKKVWVGNAATTPIQLLGGGADGNFTNISVSSVATFGAGTVSAPSITTSGDTNTGIYFPAADTIAFTEGGVESMRIDSSGRLGIGVTSPDGLITLPAAASNTPKIRLQSSTSDVDVTISSYADASGTYAAFGSNFYLDSAGDEAVFDATKRSAFVRVDGRVTGAVSFGTATTGIATERMRITSGGDVGIGTTSPTEKLHVSGIGRAGRWRADEQDASAPAFSFTNDINTGMFSSGSDTLNFATGGSERMRINSSGDVGVGTTSPKSIGNYKFITTNATTGSGYSTQVNGTEAGNFYANSSATVIQEARSVSMIFETNATERMRITSSGNLLIGTTSTLMDSEAVLVATNTGVTQNIRCAASSGGAGIHVQRSASTGNLLYFTYTTGATYVGQINTNGTSTSYSSASDYRLKDEITPMTAALETVAQLKPVKFKFKSDGSDGQGFIAHELQAVVPDAVVGEKDAVDAEGKPVYQGVDTSFLVATLTAAIQELNAKVEAQAAEIALLKSK
jgi:hypothetical protein